MDVCFCRAWKPSVLFSLAPGLEAQRTLSVQRASKPVESTTDQLNSLLRCPGSLPTSSRTPCTWHPPSHRIPSAPNAATACGCSQQSSRALPITRRRQTRKRNPSLPNPMCCSLPSTTWHRRWVATAMWLPRHPTSTDWRRLEPVSAERTTNCRFAIPRERR